MANQLHPEWGPIEYWHRRERRRFATGEYRPLPWATESWWRCAVGSNDDCAPQWDMHLPATPHAHFAHVSSEDPSRIAYTQSPHHGRADRQTRIKPGRYLRKLAEQRPDLHLDDKRIQRLAGMFAAACEANELHFATDADDIERVYTEGPSSCMAYERARYDSAEHPVRVYGDSDLSVAYIERDGTISARVLVWEARRVYGRIYGDGDRMHAALERAGYSEGSFRGARINAIEAENAGFVVPWIDGDCSTAADRGDGWLHIGAGYVTLRNTTGLSEPERRCARCDCGMGEDETCYLAGIEEEWCESCYAEHAIYCPRCEESSPDDGSEDVSDDRGQIERWCESCVRQDANECARCDSYAQSDATVWIGEDPWCYDCYERYGFYCDRCDSDQESEGSETVGPERWCEVCIDDDATECNACGDFSPNETAHPHGYCDGCHAEDGDGPEPDCVACERLRRFASREPAPEPEPEPILLPAWATMQNPPSVLGTPFATATEANQYGRDCAIRGVAMVGVELGESAAPDCRYVLYPLGCFRAGIGPERPIVAPRSEFPGYGSYSMRLTLLPRISQRSVI